MEGQVGMARIVCLLTPQEAEGLEQDGRVPRCDLKRHSHISQVEADQLVAAFRDVRGQIVEGYGEARTVRGSDGRRRVTPLARILRFTSIPDFYAPDGAMGVTTMQPVYENLR
jgi:hypothetical protein